MPQSLFRNLSAAVAAGIAEPLPMPWPDMAAEDVAIRRGQVHMWAAAPGAGKTALTLNYLATDVVRSSVACMYFSPDSDIMTVGPRMLGIMRNQRVSQIHRAFERGDTEELMEMSKQLRHVQWCFEYPLDYDVIDLEIAAYQEIQGHSPDLIVLDNIRDVLSDTVEGSGEWQAQKEAVNYFKQIAGKTGAAVVVLHHLTGNRENGDSPPTLGDVENKVGKNVRQVLLLFAPDEHTLGVRKGKDSNGKKHFDDEYIGMNWDRPTQRIG